jgi:anaerobic selenocysteine-containing dehydrogenase
MCAQHCPAFAYVKDGKVIRLESNPVHEYHGVCGRARAAVAALYSEDRIKTPLIRTGERGKGEFRQATWDEALDTIADKMKALRKENKADRVVYFPRFTAAPKYDNAFFHIYGTPNIVGYGDTCFNVVSSSSKAILNFGGPGAHSSDFENADYGLIVGKNLGGAIIAHDWGPQLGKGLRRGLPLTVVDPRQPNEMAQSYAQWLPIRPGTDYSFLLGVLYYVFQHDFLDMAFLKQTNVDALIDTKTLLPARLDKEITPNDYLVYDMDTSAFVMSRKAKKPALEGSYTWEGKTLVPALVLLRKSVLENNPEQMAEVCGISTKEMENVAKKLHKAAPKAFVEIGYRFTRHSADFRAQLAIHMLNMLLGLYGHEGGVLRNRNPGLGGMPISVPAPGGTNILQWQIDNDPDRWAASPVEGRSSIVKAFLEEKPFKPELLFFWGQDLVGGTAGGADITKFMKEVDTVVAVSPYWQDSIMYADVILPGCTFLEQDQPLYTGYKSLIPVIGVNQKAVDPVMGSRDGYWILCQIAKRVLTSDEYETYFKELEEKGLRPLWEKQFAGISGLTPEEMKRLPPTLDDLLDHGSWGTKRIIPEHKPKNATGVYEVYSFWLAETFHRLKTEHPDYEFRDHASPLMPHMVTRWYQAQQTMGKDEFIPASGFSPLSSFAGGQTRNNPVLITLQDKMKFPMVFINKNRAKELKLKEGDMIEVWMDAYPDEKQTAMVTPSKTIHPDVLFYYHGIGKGLMQTPDRLRFAKKHGLNINHFGRLAFSHGVAGHIPQDIILRIRRLS